MYKELVESTFNLNEADKVKATSLTSLIELCAKTLMEQGPNADLNFIDTSKIKTFSKRYGRGYFGLFAINGLVSMRIDELGGNGKSVMKNFNANVSDWNVSKVEDFTSCFAGCENFNGDLSKWNVSKGSDFSGMFNNCKKFNSNIGGWDVSKAKSMSGMFDGATKFNQDLSKWNTSSCEWMGYMFRDTSFDKDISKWDVSKVINFSSMFENNKKFSCDLSKWQIKSARSGTDIQYMFPADGKFPHECIKNWDIGNLYKNMFVFVHDGEELARKILGDKVNE